MISKKTVAIFAKKKIRLAPQLLVLAHTRFQPLNRLLRSLLKHVVEKRSDRFSTVVSGPGTRYGVHAVVRTRLMDDVFRRTRFRGCNRFG